MKKNSRLLKIFLMIGMVSFFLLACGLTTPTPLSSPEPIEKMPTDIPFVEENDLVTPDSATPTITVASPTGEPAVSKSTPTAQATEPIVEVVSPTDELLSALPLLEDATGLYKSSETGQTYKTQKSIEEAVQYYLDQLPAQGWTYDEASSVPGTFYIFEQERFEMMLQVFESSGERFVVMDLIVLEDDNAEAQANGMIFPEDAQVENFFTDEQTGDMRGEFITSLMFDELIAFYSQTFSPENGWRLIPYAPSEDAFAGGARGEFYLQNETREFSFYLQPAEDGNNLIVSFYNEPITTYTEVTLPEEVVDLLALVGDAKNVEVVSESSSTFVVFFSHKPYDELVGLYRDNLDGLGWTVLSDNFFETGTTFVIEKNGVQWNLFLGKNAVIPTTNITLRTQ